MCIINFKIFCSVLMTHVFLFFYDACHYLMSHAKFYSYINKSVTTDELQFVRRELYLLQTRGTLNTKSAGAMCSRGTQVSVAGTSVLIIKEGNLARKYISEFTSRSRIDVKM
jgi:hypothetical protein